MFWRGRMEVGVLRNNVWASADGKAWKWVAAPSFLSLRTYGGLAVHNGTLFSFGGLASVPMSSLRRMGRLGRRWGISRPVGGKGIRWLLLGGVCGLSVGRVNRDIWRSADGGELGFGLGSRRLLGWWGIIGLSWGRGRRMIGFCHKRRGFRWGMTRLRCLRCRRGTTAPVTLANLFLWGGRGGYSGRVGAGGDGFAVTVDGRVAAVVVTSVPAAATVATVTLVFGDGTPDGRYEHVVTVHFVAASGGDGGFSD